MKSDFEIEGFWQAYLSKQPANGEKITGDFL
jgi:hypothetical protein